MFFIHIGQRKTGSTTIQSFFADNALSLKQAGLIYPNAGRKLNDKVSKAHRMTARAMYPSRFVPKFGDESDRLKVLGRLTKLAKNNAGKKYFLSSESFEGLGPDEIRNLLEILQPHQVQAIAYVRNFSEQVVSFFNQRTKSSTNNMDFDAFFEAMFTTGIYKTWRTGDGDEPLRLDFVKIKNWSDIVGPGNAQVRVLDPEWSGNNRLIEDLLSLMGLSLKDIDVATETVSRKNSSKGWKVVEVVRAVNKSIEAVLPTQDLLRTVSKKGGGRLLDECERIAADMGIADDRARYLTLQQEARARAEFAEKLEDIKDIVSSPVTHRSASGEEDRPFLPTFARIPAEERREFLAQLSTSGVPKHFPDGLFQKALQRLSETADI